MKNSTFSFKRMGLFAFSVMTVCVFLSCSPIAKNTLAKKIGDNSKAGVVEFKKGNLLTARSFFEAALRDAYSVDNLEEIVKALNNLADIALQSGDLPSAQSRVNLALEYARNSQLTNTWFDLYMINAKIIDHTASNAGDFADAYSNYQLSLTQAKTEEDKAQVWNNLGIHFMRQNKWIEASNYIQKALRINENKKNISCLADNYFNMGDYYNQTGNLKAALTSYQMALFYDKQAERPLSVLEDLKKLGELYARLDDSENSRYHYKRALNAAKSLGLSDDVKSLEAILQ